MALRVRSQCRKCQKPLPIDELETGKTLTCPSCGFAQAFTPQVWRRVIQRAHDVADLSGGPEGQRPARFWFGADNPYAALGLEEAETTVKQDTKVSGKGPAVKTTVWVEHRPGHPVCDECRSPLDLEERTATGAVLSCPRGHPDVRTSFDPSMSRHSDALVAVLADGHRDEQEAPDGTLHAEAGRVGCASCGAPLPTTGRERLLRCEFCGAMTHVSAPVRHDLQEEPEPDTLWLGFAGDSPLRRSLERHPDTWSEGKEHREIQTLEVAPRPVGTRTRWLLAYGAPLAATAIAGLAVLVWIYASQTMGVPLPDMVSGTLGAP